MPHRNFLIKNFVCSFFRVFYAKVHESKFFIRFFSRNFTFYVEIFKFLSKFFTLKSITIGSFLLWDFFSFLMEGRGGVTREFIFRMLSLPLPNFSFFLSEFFTPRFVCGSGIVFCGIFHESSNFFFLYKMFSQVLRRPTDQAWCKSCSKTNCPKTTTSSCGM